jgi:alpha-1,3-mannosyltransferase
MNILLFAPAYALLTYQSQGLQNALLNALLSLTLQLLLGAPFLLSHPTAYLSKSFEFSRQFFYVWTVNWRFVPEHVFLSRGFANALLLGTLGCWGFYIAFVYTR